MIGSVALSPPFNHATTATTLFCLALGWLCLLSCATGEYEGRGGESTTSSVSNDRPRSNEFGSCTDGKCIKRTTSQQSITSSGMWFGPRLGRRRRSDRKSEAEIDIEALANALEGSRWAVVTIPSGSSAYETEKRQPTQFTPRLGRESGEEFGSMYSFPKDKEELYAEESPLLQPPRLGRRLPWSWTQPPRLGRQSRTTLFSTSPDRI